MDELIWNGITGGVFPKVPLPTSVTGAAVIISFSGVEINYTLYDEWLMPDSPVSWGDRGYDFNKTKGGDVALTYKGQVGPGKLAVRAFYFDEQTDCSGIIRATFSRTTAAGDLAFCIKRTSGSWAANTPLTLSSTTER